jgi:hypothetical protein
MRDKRGQTDFDQSEPEFLIGVMNRHADWLAEGRKSILARQGCLSGSTRSNADILIGGFVCPIGLMMRTICAQMRDRRSKA